MCLSGTLLFNIALSPDREHRHKRRAGMYLGNSLSPPPEASTSACIPPGPLRRPTDLSFSATWSQSSKGLSGGRHLRMVWARMSGNGGWHTLRAPSVCHSSPSSCLVQSLTCWTVGGIPIRSGCTAYGMMHMDLPRVCGRRLPRESERGLPGSWLRYGLTPIILNE